MILYIQIVLKLCLNHGGYVKAKIGKELLVKIKPKDKPYEIYDTELKGFTLRVQPAGGLTYLVRYRWDGKQTRIVVGKHPINTPAQAREEARRVLAGLLHNISPVAEKPNKKVYTLESFICEEYEPWVELDQKNGKGTIKRLKACFKNQFSSPLTSISPFKFDIWRTERLKAGIKPSTINRDLTALKALLSKAVEWSFLTVNPLSKVKQSKIDSITNVRYLCELEEKRLMTALDDRETKIRAERTNANAWRAERGYPLFPNLNTTAFADHLKPMVLISINTGIRWGELASLTWKDSIDIQRAMLTVNGNSAKSGKTLHVPLNKIALATLKGWQKQSNSTLVFPGREDNVLDNVNKSWHAVMVAAGISNFRWHDLRHHFASKLVMSGVDLNTVRELLGHSDIKMTLRYAHLAPEHKAAAVAKLV